MSPRTPTIDGLDDTDDDDGVVADDHQQDSDLKLHRVDEDEADLGGAGDQDDGEADDDATGHRG
jgi:hypothetical protein